MKAQGLALDDEFKRDQGGKFTSGGGSSGQKSGRSFGTKLAGAAKGGTLGALKGAGRGLVSPMTTGLGFAPGMHKEFMSKQDDDDITDKLGRGMGHFLNLEAGLRSAGGANLLAAGVGGIGGAIRGAKKGWRGDAKGRRGGRASDKAGMRDFGGE